MLKANLLFRISSNLTISFFYDI